MDDVRRARRGLLVFFGVLIPLSGAVDAMILLRTPKVSRSALIFALMWVPALSSFIARLATREGFGDLSPRLGGLRGARALYVAAVFPLVVGAIAYGIAWATGLAPFAAPDEDMAWMLPPWPVALSGSPEARFAQSLGVHLTISAVSGCAFAAGEEIGWRGYLVTRLVDAKIPGAIPLSGLIWAAWHYPLALRSKDEHIVFSLAMFTLLLIPIGGFLARLRMESGSVWPAIVFHGLWNELIGFVFSGFTPEPSLWVGESGILVVGVSILLCVPLLRGRWAARRRPGASPYASIGLLALALAALPGCGPPALPAEVESCKLQGIGDKEPSAQREVVIGSRQGDSFEPYRDGDKATLIRGSQGLTMVTPVVGVQARPGDPSEMCLLVKIRSEYPPETPSGSGGAGGSTGSGGFPGTGGADAQSGSGGAGAQSGSGGAGAGSGTGGDGGANGEGPPPSTVIRAVKFVREGDHLFTNGPIYNPVAQRHITLIVTVTGPDFTGTETVTITGN